VYDYQPEGCTERPHGGSLSHPSLADDQLIVARKRTVAD
jgi:hypothetical protein